MKKYLTISLFLLHVILGQAANMKVVGVTTQLNIREEPSEYSNIVGKLQNGEVVHFICEMDPEMARSSNYYWYEIEYKGIEGWVLANHMEMTDEIPAWNSEKEEKPHHVAHSFYEALRYSISDSFDAIHISVFEHHADWLVYVLLGLALIISFIGQGRFGYDISDDGPFWFTIALFVVEIIAIFIYGAGHVNPLWLITPDEVGWVATILNALCVIVYIVGYFDGFGSLLNACNERGGRFFNFNPGLLTFYISYFLWWLVGFHMHGWGLFFFGIMTGSQILQLLRIIYTNVRDQCSWENFGFTIGIYVLGLFGGLLTMIGTIEVIIAVIILFLINAAPNSKEETVEIVDNYGRRHEAKKINGRVYDGNKTYRVESDGTLVEV